MSSINCIRLRLNRAGGFQLHVDLRLPAQGITALFGPSGSGKTTVLRCIAGLETAHDALVEIGGECWQDDERGQFLPTWRRSLGYVFQEASLFEHLDVQNNLSFGLKRVGRSQGVTAQSQSQSQSQVQALDSAIELLGISHLLKRHPYELSGGERQRVAIARALATQPRLLLLDEPLTALDMARRQEVMPWLERLRDELQLPMVYVTHSADEMARLADTLVLMDEGRALACGPVQEVLLRTDLKVVPWEDTGVLLQGEVLERDVDWHLARLGFPGGSLWVRDTGLPLGQAARIRVLARDVSLATELPRSTSMQNLLPCTVTSVSPDPQHASQVLVLLHCIPGVDQSALLARITARAAQALDLATGQCVWAQVKSAALVR